MIYGYARVSTKGQVEGNSLEDQKRKLEGAGAEVVYSDAFTGTKGDRPELNKLMGKLKDGDTLVVCKLDRVARSIKVGVDLIDELTSRGVTVNILNLGILDNTPSGKLMRNVFLAFAEFERDMIVERTTEGKMIAREQDGWSEGRKRNEYEGLENCIKSYLNGEKKAEEICSENDIQISTFYRRVQEYKKQHNLKKKTKKEIEQERYEKLSLTEKLKYNL